MREKRERMKRRREDEGRNESNEKGSIKKSINMMGLGEEGREKERASKAARSRGRPEQIRNSI